MAGADNSKEFLGWFDSQRNEPCYFSRAGDGMMRCLPSGGNTNTFYLDAGCTQRVVYFFKGSCPATPLYGAVGVPGNPASCTPGGNAIHSVGAQIGPQSIYVMDAGAGICVAISAADWASSYDVYVLGAEIPPTQFVAGQYLVE